MPHSPQRNPDPRGARRALGGAVGAALIAIGLATGAAANAAPTPEPEVFKPKDVRGNPWICIDRGYEYGFTVARNIPSGGDDNSVTTPVVNNGQNVLGKDTPENPNHFITLTSANGVDFAWQTNFPVGAVIVKGSSNFNEYVYSPAALSGGQEGDGGPLTTPDKDKKGKPAKINQVTLCWGAPPPPQPKLGSITVTKQVTGALPNDPHTFNFSITEEEKGTDPADWVTSNFTLTDGESKTIFGIAAGTRNILREGLGDQMPAGYDFDRLACEIYEDFDAWENNEAPIGSTGAIDKAQATLDITDGEHVHCIYTNEQLPQLIISKSVLGAGEGDDTGFGFSLDGSPVATLANGESTTEPIYLSSGTDRVLTEDALPDGYAFGEAACTLPEREPWPARDAVATAVATEPVTYDQAAREATINVPAGTVVECAYTNVKLPTLTVIKNVVNDNGGTLAAGDFTMNVNGTALAEPASFAGSAQGTTLTLVPGTYAVDEDEAPGYAKTLGEGCAGTLAAGDAVTCTITNDDIAPQLTVIKVVDNSNGGGTLTPGDFTLQAEREGLGTISFPGSDGTPVALNAGTYAVTEPDTQGYSATFSADCAGTIALGESRTCTVTNTSPAPEIPVIPDTPITPDTPVTPPAPPAPVVAAAPQVVVQGVATQTRPALTRLAIAKNGPKRARALQRFTYTIRVRNTGRNVARNVIVRDALPAGLVPVRTAPRSTQRGRVLTFRLGNMRPGQVRGIRVTVRAAASIKGRKTNIAVARAANARPVRAQARTVFAPLVRQVVPAVTG